MKKNSKGMSHSKSTYALTPEEMFHVITGKDDLGIYGYHCPKIYQDAKRQVWERKREQILNSHKGQWPPEDWPADKETGKKNPPKRWNFIEDQIKWANSFNDPKKSEEIKENLEQKGLKIGEFHPYKSDFDKKVNTRNLRTEFIGREKELIEIRNKIKAIPEYRQSAIEQVEEKMKSASEYKGKNKGSNWAKGMRVLYNADNEYVSEVIPFWNPNKKEEDKAKAEFKPNKLKFMHRNPSWLIGPKRKAAEDDTAKNASSYIQARDEKLEEKANSVLEKMGLDRKTYVQEPQISFFKVQEHGRLPLLIRKVFDYASTDQYKAAQEKKSSETPAPNSYWDDGKSRVRLRKNIEEDQAAKYVMPREKTYKRLYVSSLRKSVY